MALPPLAEVTDLADWVGETISLDDPRAVAVLSRTSALVRSVAGLTWVDDLGELASVPEDVQGVVVQAAARVWTNPDGAIQRATGPFSFRLADAAGEGLYLTETERAILARYSTRTSGIWTLQRERGDLVGTTEYVPTGPPPSGYPFPWYAGDV